MSVWSFRRLDIERMPGCDRFTLDGFSSGVNIISGPNASGKSTTARAIMNLLWPSKARPGEEASGIFDLSGEQWQVSVCNRRGVYKAGASQQPGSPNPVSTDRRAAFHLALPDLITDDNSDFAKAIHMEAAGGYDIAECVKELDYRSTSYQPSGLKDGLRKKEEEVSARQHAQAMLNEKESSLDTLREQLAEADKASRQIYLISEALEVSEKRADLREAEEALKQFDIRMADLRPGDGDMFDNLKHALNAALLKRSEAVKSFREARSEMAECELPRGVELIQDDIEARNQEWHRLEVQLQDTLKNFTRLEGQEAAAFQNIADIDEETLKRISRDPARIELVNYLEEFGREAVRLDAELQACDSIRSWVGKPDLSISLDSARDGLMRLLDWLSGTDTASRNFMNPWLSLACGIGIGIGLIFAKNNIVFLLCSLIILIVAYLAGKGTAKPGERTAARMRFEELGITGPDKWTEESVRGCVRQLQESIADLQRTEHWNSLAGKRENLEEQFNHLRERSKALEEKFGVRLRIEHMDLVVLADSIGRWLNACEEASGAKKICEHLRMRIAEQSSAINSILAGYGYAKCEDSISAGAGILDIKSRKQKYDLTLSKAKHALSELKSARSDIEHAGDELNTFYKRVGIEPDDEQALRSLLSNYAAYESACNVQRSRLAVLEAAQNRLNDEITEIDQPVSGFTDLSESELVNLRTSLQARADNFQPLNKRIIETETEIQTARSGRDLERSLSELEACRDQLREKRNEGYSAAVGWSLAEFVKREARKASLPAVFHRANEVFSEITGYRFTIEFDHDHAAFAAYDTIRNSILDLNQLSSGTRIQLLLSVRIAFVEQQEQGVKLPLILDETLAASDDERAEKIIETVINLCKNGRQIFYFTAQAHEIEKWKYYLDKAGMREEIDYHHEDLARIEPAKN